MKGEDMNRREFLKSAAVGAAAGAAAMVLPGRIFAAGRRRI